MWARGTLLQGPAERLPTCLPVPGAEGTDSRKGQWAHAGQLCRAGHRSDLASFPLRHVFNARGLFIITVCILLKAVHGVQTPSETETQQTLSKRKRSAEKAVRRLRLCGLHAARARPQATTGSPSRGAGTPAWSPCSELWLLRAASCSPEALRGESCPPTLTNPNPLGLGVSAARHSSGCGGGSGLPRTPCACWVVVLGAQGHGYDLPQVPAAEHMFGRTSGSLDT